MKTLHSERTEAFYKKVLEESMESYQSSNLVLAPEYQQTLEEFRVEEELHADEVAYGLEIRLTDAQLADIEADVKAGCSMDEIRSDETVEAIQEAWDDAGELNNVVVIEHDSLSIVQSILEKLAAGKELDKGHRHWAGYIAQFLNSRYKAEGCWIETPKQKHDRFVADKQRREKSSLKEVTA